MEQILIEVDTPQDKELLLALLPKLNSRVIASIPDQAKKAIFIQMLNDVAREGGVKDSYGDASEWQREIRSSDRVLYGREE